jgi:phytoene dehydrogenase-like protein
VAYPASSRGPAGHAYDAVVVGSGPNGLAAAITLARAGRSVVVIEAQEEPGGGAQSAELTQAGFVHDVFSAVHPLALESEFFQSLPLEQFGLNWIQSPAVYAHPLDGGEATFLRRSVAETAASLGRDERVYAGYCGRLIEDWDYYKSEFLRPLRFPRHPLRMASFGIPAVLPANLLSRLVFRETHARALFAGSAAHSTLSLNALGSSAFALMLMLAGHHVGWPLPRGGARSVSQALVAYLRSLGGEVVTGTRIENLAQLPRARATLFDLTPRQIVAIAGKELGSVYSASLQRYRYGAGVFKLDWALRAPIPWKNAQVADAATVHLGGTLEELVFSEREVAAGRLPERPFVLLVQPSLFDSIRAPSGCHTAWAYCHVPNGSTVDMTDRIEAQIERFAPGFRDVVLARSALSPRALETRNANLVGGDINGGSVHLPQLFLRPTIRLYSTPRSDLFICSSSTPPGGGVHGLCGYFAAQEALRTVLKN